MEELAVLKSSMWTPQRHLLGHCGKLDVGSLASIPLLVTHEKNVLLYSCFSFIVKLMRLLTLHHVQGALTPVIYTVDIYALYIYSIHLYLYRHKCEHTEKFQLRDQKAMKCERGHLWTIVDSTLQKRMQAINCTLIQCP